MQDLARANPDLKFVIEYKPREPRTHMFWSSAAKTVLGIQAMGVDNVGVLLDFGHTLFGGESPAEAAQLLIDHGLLWGMDVNDDYRGWDDDMVNSAVNPGWTPGVSVPRNELTLNQRSWTPKTTITSIAHM